MALPDHIRERDGAVLVSVRVRPRGGRDKVVRLAGLGGAEAAARLGG